MDTKAAFEKWFERRAIGMKRNGLGLIAIAREKSKALESWQASRAAIEIELPQRQSLCASGYGDGYFVPSSTGEGLEYDEVVEAITSHGIRIKVGIE